VAPMPTQYVTYNGGRVPPDRALAPLPRSAAGYHQMVPRISALRTGDASAAAPAVALSAATCGPEKDSCENARNRRDSRVSSGDRPLRGNRGRLLVTLQ